MRGGQHRLFPPFCLDPANAQLWRNDDEVDLRPKAFEVLCYLVDRPGQLVTKSELLDAIWPEVNVSDSMPATCINELRKALGDEVRSPRFIETVHRRGYRFIAKVTRGTKAEKTVPTEPAAPKRATEIVVGRDQELAELRDLYAQVLDGNRRVVFVSGEAGIGKSALVKKFMDSVAGEGITCIAYGQCLEHFGAGEPYLPVFEALSRLAKGTGGEHIIEILSRFAPMWLAQMPGLLDREDRARLQSELQGVTQQRMLREISEALEAMAAREPLLLVLEDLHWSDFSTLELISAVARRKEPTPLMIVAAYRPLEVLTQDHPLRSMKQELELHHYCEELRLKLLSEKDVAQYLSERFSSNGLREFGTLAPVIYSRTDGNPLFMVNVVDYLVGKDGLIIRPEESDSGQAIASFDPPRRLREMIEHNLERLKPEEQALLEGASVAGAEFSAASVAAALNREQVEVEACCMFLSRREQFISARGALTWPDGTVTSSFRFHHSLYQEVLYSRLPPAHQIQFHQRIAARAEVGYGEHIAEIATELAHHYSLANVKKKAIKFFQLAAERAVARGAVIEAEKHYHAALKHLDGLPRTDERDRLELPLQIALGTVLRTVKSWSHAETGRVFARAQELANSLGEEVQLMAVLFGLFLSDVGGGRFGSAIPVAERMLALAERSNSRDPLSFAHTFLGETFLDRAKFRDAREHLELANSLLSASELQGLNEWAFAAPALLAITVLILGYPDRARELAARASHYAARCSDPDKVGGVHLWLGLFHGMMHDAERERGDAQVMRQLANTHPVWSGIANFFSALVRTIQGEWQDAEKYLDDAIAFHESVGLVGLLNWFNLEKAKILANRGLLDDALVLASNAATHPELAFLRVPGLQLKAEVLAQSSGDKSAIESVYREAIACARDQEAKYYQLQAVTSFARWLETSNRGTEAQTMLTEIYSWFAEGFEAPALKEAKALLAEL